MILELNVIDPKNSRRQMKAINTRYIAEIDPLYTPASEDDNTPVRAGSEITMHSGKKHRVEENLNVLLQRMGGRA